MRILLTNNSLAAHAGSELYIRDLAVELMRRGHQPVAYSTYLGAVAEELRAATIPVIDRLEALGEPPDIIHGQHHYETLSALLRFPATPGALLLSRLASVAGGYAQTPQHSLLRGGGRTMPRTADRRGRYRPWTDRSHLQLLRRTFVPTADAVAAESRSLPSCSATISGKARS